MKQKQTDAQLFNTMGLSALIRLRSLLVAELVQTQSIFVKERVEKINKEIQNKTRAKNNVIARANKAA